MIEFILRKVLRMKMLLLPEISCGAGGWFRAYAATNTIRMGGTQNLIAFG